MHDGSIAQGEIRQPALPKDWITDWRTHNLPLAQLQRFVAQQLLARSLPGEAGRFRREARTVWSIVSFAESYGIDLEPLMATVGPEVGCSSIVPASIAPASTAPATAPVPSLPNEENDDDEEDADDAKQVAPAPTGVSQGHSSAGGMAGGPMASHAAAALLYTSALEMRLRKAAESRPPPTAWRPQKAPHGNHRHHQHRPVTDQLQWREEELAADPSEPEPEALWGNWRPPESTDSEPPVPTMYQEDAETAAHARRVTKGKALRKARLRHEGLEEERRAEQAAAYAVAIKARREAPEEWVDEDVVVEESRYEQLKRIRRRPWNRADNTVLLTEED